MAGSDCSAGKAGQRRNGLLDEYNQLSVILRKSTSQYQDVDFTIIQPHHDAPDVNTNIKAFKKLDFSVVFSYHLDNPTAKLPISFCPRCIEHFEGRDLHPRGMRSPDMFSLETANMNGNYFVFKEKCVDPPGEVRARGWVWVQFGEEIRHRPTNAPRVWPMSPMINGMKQSIICIEKLTRNGCYGKKLPR